MKFTSRNNRRYLTLSRSEWLKVGQDAGWDEGTENRQTLTPTVTIKRYGDRHWAVYVDGELLCVTVYLKGARAVQQFIENYSRQDRGEYFGGPRL